MKTKTAIILAALILAPAAWAMNQSDSPPKFPIPWGNSAGGSFIRTIPTASQIGINSGWASLTDGFPPLNFQPIAAGGVPPFGQDMNGILNQTSNGVRWQQAGGPIFWDSAIATGAGGYPNGAIINSAVTPGTRWMSTADANATNPDSSGSTNWVQDPGQIQIGTPTQSLSTTVPFGQVSANGLTIGNASSNATNRANADTQFLFSFVWQNCTNSICPIFTSGGASSTRGASAAVDYAANKAIAVYNMNATGLMGADSQHGTTTTFLSGVPVTSGSRTTPSSILGEVFHSLVAAENGPHNHGGVTGTMNQNDPHTHSSNAMFYFNNFGVGTGATDVPGNNAATINATSVNHTHNIATDGSGTGHNTVERSTIVYWNLKL